jgi:hypothetical protein
MRTECLNNNIGMLITPGTGQETIWTWLHMFQADTCTSHGIKVYPTGGTVKVLNMSTCWSSSNEENGLFIDLSGGGSISEVTVTGGTFLTNKKNGIQTYGAINSLIVSDSAVICNSEAGTSLYHGIYIGPNARRVNIHGNHIGSMNNQTNKQAFNSK